MESDAIFIKLIKKYITDKLCEMVLYHVLISCKFRQKEVIVNLILITESTSIFSRESICEALTVFSKWMLKLLQEIN